MPKPKADKPKKTVAGKKRGPKKKPEPNYGERMSEIMNTTSKKIADILHEAWDSLGEIDINGTLAVSITQTVIMNIMSSMDAYRKDMK